MPNGSTNQFGSYDFLSVFYSDIYAEPLLSYETSKPADCPQGKD